MSSDVNKAASARLYTEVFEKGRFDVVDEILAADCVSHGPGMPARIGTEGIKAQAAALRGGHSRLDGSARRPTGGG